ncbi:MAG TPA: T9SS type A sorting domain-containing protein, partial [Saprospiraceae bacterium]|nr:T9SS type A sorting domain-containing protein [Saprospiraceae bacterium]
NLPEFPVVSNTQNGVFSFASVPAGVEFELSARKNDNHINGVNTLDLVTIQRHILGIAKLDNAYKYVAADADNNQRITLSDLVELRKLVLGITNELPNNTSWRFVDSKQTFADISNPWPLDEVIVTAASANANNFVAVKVGDVNTDAAVSATNANLSSRSASAVKFVVDQATINAGEVVSIPVRASNFTEAYGFQMTTELKGLELLGVQSGAISVEEGMVATPRAGVMTMSWTAANGATVSDDAVLFTINVKAKSTVDVSRAIAVSSSVTEAVAFVGSDLTASDVELEVRGAGSSAFALGQNEPNPFKAETNIKFTMPEAGEAKFRVVDVTGRVLVNQVIKAAKGENVITLKRADIAATGVVYYQIESGQFTATKKMVIIE